MQRRFQDLPALPGAGLTSLYTRTMLGYLLIMGVLWLFGLEGIYGHPTPFYALYYPALTSFSALGWQIPCIIVFFAGLAALRRWLLPRLASENTFTTKETWHLLLGIFVFSVLFAATVAMIRGGFHGIEQAYDRQAYEYVGDIGKTSSIRQLFAQYTDPRFHQNLSMHAKVHPPGPIALLWLMSYIGMFIPTTQAAFLSVATILFSCTALVPLYFWTRLSTNQRTALLACVCYSLIPSIVLFTATSADALFTPFTLATLYCFERAIRQRSVPSALLAGVGYGILIHLKFSLIGMGAYFGLVGLWMLRCPETRRNVIQTAILMTIGLTAVVLGIYWWSGFNIVESFHLAKGQFDLDQMHLDELTPRLPAWTYRILNPACWFFFAGIPVSVLALREFFSSEDKTRALWWIFALMLLVLNLLYLARGEGERSALYLFPFLVIPAAHQLGRALERQGNAKPILATVCFLAFQCWFIETVFYTYW
ncbi:MAG: glycosyltransferase family 39 protein [Candidatus Hydrogenedentes bacterium]|nr:glycosyltransferase family 39 protein [Candidatus Hydrogenedentota bacterium]